jgi:hypothetical protein
MQLPVLEMHNNNVYIQKDDPRHTISLYKKLRLRLA